MNEGGYTQLKALVRAVCPTAPASPVVRFETPPGHQAQVDFAEFRVPWCKRYALVVVLGHSRLLWLQFQSRQTMKPLAMQPYRSLVLESAKPAARPQLQSLPSVERRALAVYDQIAGAAA